MIAFNHSGRVVAISTIVIFVLLSVPPHAWPQRPREQSVVVLWNQALLDAVRLTRTSPPVAARAMAIVHTCMFDAWAAYDDVAVGTRLGASLRRPPDERSVENKKKAISFAAYRALDDLFPSQRETNMDVLMRALGYRPSESEDPSTPGGIGNSACQAVLEFRHRDGANQLGDRHPGAYSDYTGFTPANTAEVLIDQNRWQPLVVNGTPQRWLLPHWGMVTPFGLTSGAQLRDVAMARKIPRYPSPAYWKRALDVVDLSAHLGDTEKVIAEYWADGSSTVTPPGHWMVFAQYVSQRDHNNLDQDVRLFFLLGNALMDAGIAAWDTKRCTDLIRPVSVVRALLSNTQIQAWAGPGLGVRSLYGRDFRSYLPTPPFASYVSGHSAFSAAGAEILKRITGSDHFGDSYTVDPGTSLIEVGLTPTVPVTLMWPTFSDAADQAGMSRRYGGIHYEEDDLAGRALGRAVAEQVWNRAIGYLEGTATSAN